MWSSPKPFAGIVVAIILQYPFFCGAHLSFLALLSGGWLGLDGTGPVTEKRVCAYDSCPRVAAFVGVSSIWLLIIV